MDQRLLSIVYTVSFRTVVDLGGLKGGFILFYIRYASDEHLFSAMCVQAMMEEVKK